MNDSSASTSYSPWREPATTLQLPKPILAVLATRPGMLPAGWIPVGIGFACSDGNASDSWGLLLVLMLLVSLIHASANLYNDYFDQNADGDNDERLYPYSGGSRFIQNGLLSARQVALLAHASVGLALFVALGSWAWTGWAGIFLVLTTGGVAWSYSAPPLRLCSRGYGELSVATTFGILIPGATSWAIRGSSQISDWTAGAGFGLLVAAILVLCEIPDAPSDRRSGKLNLPARWGRSVGRVAFAVLILGGSGLTAGTLIYRDRGSELWAVIPCAAYLIALVLVVRSAQRPEELRPAIGVTLLTTLLHGVCLSVALGPTS